MIFISNNKAFVWYTSLPEVFKLKIFSNEIIEDVQLSGTGVKTSKSSTDKIQESKCVEYFEVVDVGGRGNTFFVIEYTLCSKLQGNFAHKKRPPP